MRFSSGVYAQVTLKECVGRGHYFYDSRSVYDFLIQYFGHDISASAESWTELASIGELYETDGFEIEMMEEQQVEKKVIELTKAEQDYTCLICCKKKATVKATINRLTSYDDTVVSFHMCDECLAKAQQDIQKICE